MTASAPLDSAPLDATPAPAATYTTASLYLSDSPYVTAASDTGLPHVAFDPRVLSVAFRYSVSGGGRLGGRAAFDGGSIEIANNDRALDTYLRTYAIDGQRVVVKVGSRAAMAGGHYAYSDFLTLFDGTAAGWTFGRGAVTVRLRGIDYKLRLPLNATAYLGTGGVEGGDDLKGKQRPSAWGVLFNAPAVRLNTDLVYELCHAIVSTIDVVRDAGNRLVLDTGIGTAGDFSTYAALVAATIGAGKYATCKALGLIRLQTEPAGQVTADFSTALTMPGEIAEDILRSRGGLASSQVEPGGLAQLDSVYPYPIGLYFGPDADATVADALDQIAAGVEGFWGERADGRAYFGLVAAPSGSWAWDIADADAINLRVRDLPASVSPAVWRASVGYQRAIYVQTDGLDSAITAADRAAITTRYRRAVWADLSVQALHATARQLVIGAGDDVAEAQTEVSIWATEEGAQQHANRLGAIYAGAYRLVDVELGPEAWLRQIGDMVALSVADEGLSQDLAGVLGRSIDTGRARGELTALGAI